MSHEKGTVDGVLLSAGRFGCATEEVGGVPRRHWAIVYCAESDRCDTADRSAHCTVCVEMALLVERSDAGFAVAEVSATVYWRSPFYAVAIARQLVEYSVIDCDMIDCVPAVAYGAKLSNRVSIVIDRRR